MSYTRPENVDSPRAHWRLERVALDRGPQNCAYAFGEWDGEARIGFRWNGTDQNPIGNPQSRGLPTWTILDPELYETIVLAFPVSEQRAAREFLGLGLSFDSVSVSGDRIVLFDVRKRAIAGVKCDDLRNILKRPTMTNDDCRMILDQSRDVVLEIANPKFARRNYVEDKGLRLINITADELQAASSQFQTSVLDVAATFVWIA